MCNNVQYLTYTDIGKRSIDDIVNIKQSFVVDGHMT